jgi:hypothetical protein
MPCLSTIQGSTPSLLGFLFHLVFFASPLRTVLFKPTELALCQTYLGSPRGRK